MTGPMVVTCPGCGEPNEVEAARHEGVCVSCRAPMEPDLDDPEVVCLCGSTRFKEEYRRENARLTLEGRVVLTVGLFGHADDVDLDRPVKHMLDELHKRKIDLADRVHVINPGGYVGDSTEDEIEYARAAGKDVTWVEAP